MQSDNFREQAGFQKNYSTNEHLCTIRTLLEIEIAKIHLDMHPDMHMQISIDYEKVFDSFEM